MKITVKTTQQKVYQVEVEASDNIATIKQKIEEGYSHPVASQKIIYSGKILSDDKVIESCGIKEKDFLVLMVSKPKGVAVAPPTSTSSAPAPAPAPATPSPAPVSAPAALPAPVDPAPAPAPPTEEVPAPVAQSETAAPGGLASGSFLSGTAYQSAVSNLEEMGFPHEDVVRAMRASFNNPDRAADYLMNGIPPELEQIAAQGAPAAATTAAATPSAVTAGEPAPAPAPPANQPQNLFQLAHQQQQQQHGGGSGAGGGLGPAGLNLEALRNSPQIQQIRQALHENPNHAQLLLQQLAAANPGIAQMIGQDPAILANLLGVSFGEGDGDDDIPPGAAVVNVTPEESAAIQRLEGLGFPRHIVVEAYLACDKNEELAANYLFEHGFEDDAEN